MFLLVVFTAIYVPLRIALIDQVTSTVLGFELAIDSIFFIDVLLTFFTAIEIENGLETNKWMIALIYLRTWFFIDLFSW